MKTTTTHPYVLPDAQAPAEMKSPYRILDYPSGNLLAVEIEGGEVLMDRDQAVELLRVLQLAVPELDKQP